MGFILDAVHVLILTSFPLFTFINFDLFVLATFSSSSCFLFWDVPLGLKGSPSRQNYVLTKIDFLIRPPDFLRACLILVIEYKAYPWEMNTRTLVRVSLRYLVPLGDTRTLNTGVFTNFAR